MRLRILLAIAFALLVFGPGRQVLAQAQDSTTPSIIGLNNGEPAALDGQLQVRLSGTGILDPTKYTLFIDGRPIKGLNETLFDRKDHALVFRLRRNEANEAAWKALLGSPTAFTRPVTIALGEATSPGAAPVPTIRADTTNDTLDLTVISGPRALVALIVAILVIAALWLAARRTTLLRDNLLPQIAPNRQTYSLGRWQMAFWFVLILVSYVVLFLLFGSVSTISPQALWLMGISGATGVGAIAVDVLKDSPADAANRGLQALGLKTYEDVLRTRREIADRQGQLAAVPAPHAQIADRLKMDIRDRQLLLTAYENAIAPFVSEGWYRDLTTDLNGASLHRLQAFCWTWVLGFVFIHGIYTGLTMPSLDSTLLLLMGVSSTGYVGFKYPEPQQ